MLVSRAGSGWQVGGDILADPRAVAVNTLGVRLGLAIPEEHDFASDAQYDLAPAALLQGGLERLERALGHGFEQPGPLAPPW